MAMPLWNSSDPTDVARLEAQARLVAAYEEMKWPRRPAERRRFDPPPYGPARFNALGETVFRGRKIKMRVRGADGKAQIGTLKGAI